jgi:pimeloyl-ACP methyl ester carboxylesterase
MLKELLAWLGGATIAVSATACSAPDPVPAAGGEATAEPAALTQGDVTFEATLRASGKVAIHAVVYRNDAARNGANVLAVHGLSETGFTYRPLAETIFRDPILKRKVKNVIGLDLPGHGDSGFPTGLPAGVRFGDLAIEDNVSVIIQALDALRAKRLAPRVIVGHSMGGLEVQAAQQALLAQHSSLAAHGVFAAVLLAPVPPHGQAWSRAPGGDPTPFIVDDPVLGSYLNLPPEVFVFQAFGTLAGTLPPNAPTPAEVAANRYVGPEPLFTLLQLVESTLPLPDGTTITLERPTVAAGAFSPRNGTLTTVVGFAQDPLVPAGDLDDLYVHLTQDRRKLLYREVTTDDAVHAMYVSNPAGMLEAIRRVF